MDASRREQQASTAKPSRIFIACVRCKRRKIKCDGKSPKCTSCASKDAECVYAPVRKTRGLGRRKGATWQENAIATSQPEVDQQSTAIPNLGNQARDLFEVGLNAAQILDSTSARLSEASAPNNTTSSPSNSSFSRLPAPSPGFLSLEAVKQRIPTFLDVLRPEVFASSFKAYKQKASSAGAARRFVPLLPPHIARPLVHASLTEIMPEGYEMLDVEGFIAMLDAQYTNSWIGPGDNPARWAQVNAVLVLAVRYKTARGSEGLFRDITEGLYRNATSVMPEIVLGEPSLLGVQGLLAMAMCMRDSKNKNAFVMLAGNASRMLDLFRTTTIQRRGTLVGEEALAYERVDCLVRLLDTEAVIICSAGVGMEMM